MNYTEWETLGDSFGFNKVRLLVQTTEVTASVYILCPMEIFNLLAQAGIDL
jgi:hypothetical protein